MDKENIIKVQIKNVWGMERIYPTCSKGKLFASLTGQKTLTRGDVEIIKKIGYKVQLIEKEPVL